MFWISERKNGKGSGLVDFANRVVSFFNRNHSQTAEPDTIEVLGLVIDRRRHRAKVDGEQLELTPTEFRVLWTLASQAGLVLSRQHLAEECMKAGSAVKQRTVDAHIKSIRRKLGKRSDLVETVRGIGYRFLEP